MSIPVTPPGIENATFRLYSSVPEPTVPPRTSIKYIGGDYHLSNQRDATIYAVY
jgi:hypothetical protein